MTAAAVATATAPLKESSQPVHNACLCFSYILVISSGKKRVIETYLLTTRWHTNAKRTPYYTYLLLALL